MLFSYSCEKLIAVIFGFLRQIITGYLPVGHPMIALCRTISLTALLLLAPHLSLAAVMSSADYHYKLSTPSGWVQVPASELILFKATLPPQAAHLIYDAAIQRQDRGWFEYPYVVIMVTPPQVTHISRLPTESEFDSFVRGIS